MTTIDCYCKRCGAPMKVAYEPNEFVSENFVRLTATCDLCSGGKRGPDAQENLPLKMDEAQLPYKDS